MPKLQMPKETAEKMIDLLATAWQEGFEAARHNDEPLIVAHLLGGANGVSFDQTLTGEDIKARVQLAIQYQQEIMLQLEALPRHTLD